MLVSNHKSKSRSDSSRRTFRHAKSRRGVTLLFVVSMIVLFLLMATSFVVISNDYYRSARKRSLKFTGESSNPVDLIERSFYDLVRGPSLKDSLSPLRGHSLLGDMYGYGFVVTASSAGLDDSEHFLDLTLNNDAVAIIDGSPYTPIPVPGLFGGLVLTVTSGSSTGLSGRIIDHQVAGDASIGYTHRVLLMATTKDGRFSAAAAGAMTGARLVINGRPFAGTGAGHYDPYLAQNKPALSGSAKTPNWVGKSFDELVGKPLDPSDPESAKPGYFTIQARNAAGEKKLIRSNSQAPNESYDALDVQNVFLGALNADGSPAAVSFHRGEDKKKRGTFSPFEDINYDGDIDPLTSDKAIVVDNNNDGVDDGVWIDTGLPVECRDDGRCVKPLVSYLVVDLDGRINVNAHGSLFRDFARNNNMASLGFLDAVAGIELPRGQGYGPPEISMNSVLGSPVKALTMMSVRYGRDSDTEIGSDGRPIGLPGEPNVRDDWSKYKLFGHPEASFDQLVPNFPGTVWGHFGSAMDMHGRFATGYTNLAFDLTDPNFPVGLPMADVGASGLVNEVVDSPYEMSLLNGFGTTENKFDAPFTADELEYVLRQTDIDSPYLKKRLVEKGELDEDARNLVTTHSFEVPTLSMNLPSRLYRVLNTANDGTGTIGVPTGTDDREKIIRDLVKYLLPPETLRGLPMNVNREFGDGVDNNNNYVIDEIHETGDRLRHPNLGDDEFVTFDPDNDSIVTDPSQNISDLDDGFARSRFATHLYIVTLLATERVDRNGDGTISLSDWYDFNDDGTTDQDDLIDFRKVIAQWAINVVDFRDPDSIMTSFEFDLNPWNGWDVDSDVLTEESVLEGVDDRNMRTVVWGAERPELLITETMATHDRRTQDLENEAVTDGEEAGFIGAEDSDFDSQLVPQVSAFFELYNPWVMSDANQVRPGELYDLDQRNGVDLQKVAASAGGESPVWRLVVTESGEQDLDPDDPSENPSGDPVTHLRRIYFTTFIPSGFDVGPEDYFASNEKPGESLSKLVAPGRYAVIGSAGIDLGGDNQYTTLFGRRDAGDALNAEVLKTQTRQINLDPAHEAIDVLWFNEDNKDNSTGGFEVEERGGGDLARRVVVVPIGQTPDESNMTVLKSRNLGVSDPLEGYIDLTGANGEDIKPLDNEDGQQFVVADSEVPYVFDTPVDKKVDAGHFNDYLKDSGLKPGYRTVHLQRLANPTQAFDEQTNPYRTIDSSSIDLFVFNGVESVKDTNDEPGVMRFGSYERRCNRESANGQDYDWGQQRLLFRNDRAGYINSDEDTNDELDDSHFLNLNLYAKSVDDDGALGVLEPVVRNDDEFESLGRMNEAYRDALGADDDEQSPFAWLTWNNRPYISHLELTNVPYTSSYWTTRMFSMADDSFNVFAPDKVTNPENGRRSYSGEFSHLLNFYADKLDSGESALSLHRVFDVLEVPSRFIGTENFVNPLTFANADNGPSYGLVAPFDRVSTYRYPGKLNINTTMDSRTWEGMMGGFGGAVSFSSWQDSRMENPYRSAFAHNLVPKKDSGGLFVGGKKVNTTDGGLFRLSDSSTDQALFDYRSGSKYDDPQRAAYFKYQMRQRMGNLVTTRSSVFAIWITIGYFEVDSSGKVKQADPSSNAQGVEVGSDVGNIRRHRGFYIFDRSIPVGFEPGKNHNVDQAVLVKTIIE